MEGVYTPIALYTDFLVFSLFLKTFSQIHPWEKEFRKWISTWRRAYTSRRPGVWR
jgi:hypothetical protein